MSIKAPDLEWLQGDVPRAEGFNDTYFSKAGGLAETRHVFLRGNGLPERFDGCERFTIASSVSEPGSIFSPPLPRGRKGPTGRS